MDIKANFGMLNMPEKVIYNGDIHIAVEGLGIYCRRLQQQGFTGLKLGIVAQEKKIARIAIENKLTSKFGNVAFRYCAKSENADAILYGQNIHIIGVRGNSIASSGGFVGVFHFDVDMCKKDKFTHIINLISGVHPLPENYRQGWYVGTTEYRLKGQYLLDKITQGELVNVNQKDWTPLG